MPAGHVRVGLTLVRGKAEVAPTFDHLLRRAAADAELQPAVRNQVGRTRVLCHIHRVLIAHVDDAGADLDPRGSRAYGGKQRERPRRLPGEVVNAKVRTVQAQLLGRNSEVDGLVEEIARTASLGGGRVRPVAEGEEANLLHGN